MKLIIDIDEEMYKRICEAQSVPDMYGTDIVNAITRIQNGKILPDNHGDTISRSALRKDIEHLHSVYVENKEWFYTDVLNYIDNAPTVEYTFEEAFQKTVCENKLYCPAKQQGEWIVLVDADNIQTCKCSICGRMVDIANREFDKFPYCHCGAKMKGGAE